MSIMAEAPRFNEDENMKIRKMKKTKRRIKKWEDYLHQNQ